MLADQLHVPATARDTVSPGTVRLTAGTPTTGIPAGAAVAASARACSAAAAQIAAKTLQASVIFACIFIPASQQFGRFKIAPEH